MSAAEAPTRLAVLGQGYVGLPLAMRAVEVGFDVVGLDPDVDKIAGLLAGRSHVEDITDAALGRALATGRYRPTASDRDLAGFDVAVITVPTPLAEGVPDIGFITAAVGSLGEHLRSGSTVVLESTTYPGTTEEVVVAMLEDRTGSKAGVDFHVGYSPERIDPGNTVWDFVRTPKVVSGISEASLDSVRTFYDRLVDRTVAVSTTRAAELTKLLENTYRHVNIALVNELAIHARELGIDIWEVIEAAGSKPFGYTPFWPGPGVGGHCLPIDPSYLSWRIERQLGSASRFVEIANDINNDMPAYVVRRVQGGLNDRRKPVNGARILVLGLAYKKNSNDARETPAVRIIEGLRSLGAEVLVVDDHVGQHPIDVVAPRVTMSVDEVESADVVVVVTDHDDVDYEMVARHGAYVFDARNRVVGDAVETL